MRQQTDAEKIRRTITRGKYGSLYFASSFPGFSIEYVYKLLTQFEKEGLLVRISKGIYIKAKRTRFGISYPSVDTMVKEVARRDRAKVIPTGETAANLLGFSDQVPMKTCFLTTGTYRTLKLGDSTVLLKNAAPKNFSYHNEAVSVLVQALRSVGKNGVTEEIKARIPGILKDVPEDGRLASDLVLAPAWIRDIVVEMIKGRTCYG